MLTTFNPLLCGCTLLAAATIAAISPATRADEPAPRGGQARFEIKFMQDMIDHHHMAVMMAEMCDGRTVHTEFLALCEQIAVTQSAEIEQMQGWLQDWYGISYEPHMSRKMHRQMDALGQLSGAQFEIAFMLMMIEHHLMAIKEGDHCLKKAYHEELRDLCEQIVVSQSQEIMMMQLWLCTWYGYCAGK